LGNYYCFFEINISYFSSSLENNILFKDPTKNQKIISNDVIFH